MTVTISATLGPAYSVTSTTYSGIRSIIIDETRGMVKLCTGPEYDGPGKEFALYGVTTLTDSITSGIHSITIS